MGHVDNSAKWGSLPTPPPPEESLRQIATLGEAFAATARTIPARTAIVDNGGQRRTTFREIETLATSIALGLQRRGVGKGDRIATSLGNTLEGCLSMMACYKLGAIVVPLNPSYKSAQVIGALNHVTPKCLIVSAEAHMPSRDPVSNLPILQTFVDDLTAEHVSSRIVPSLEHIIVVGNSCGRISLSATVSLTPWDALIEGEGVLCDNEVAGDDVAMIQFTSGTTALPKGACLTHRNMLDSATATGKHLGYTGSDVICCPTPLLHIFGSLIGLATAYLFGATLVFPAEAFDTVATVNALRSEHCTALYGVPTMYTMILGYIAEKSIPKDEFRHLRTGMIAGSPVHAPLLRQVHDVLSIPELAVSWGMSELSGAATVSHPDDSLEKRTQTVGRALPHARIRVVASDDPLKEVPVGHRGELVVAGSLVMKGYWNDPVATAAVLIRDPTTGEIWMRSGDEGMLDTDGYVAVTGRIKDVIIRGGQNIYPTEIESILLEHPLVADASVVGIPDDRYGEVVGAFVVVRPAQAVPSKQELRDHVSQKLGKVWVPRDIFILDELPKTASGKIQKFELRERAKRWTQLEEQL